METKSNIWPFGNTTTKNGNWPSEKEVEYLKEKAEAVRGRLEEEIENMDRETLRYVIGGVAVAGVATASYFIVRGIKKQKEEKRKAEMKKSPKEMASNLYDGLRSTTQLFALNVAKKALSEYISKSQKESKK